MRVQPKTDLPLQQSTGGARRGGLGVGGGVGSGRPEEGGMEIVLVAVRLDAVSGQRGRNGGRGFVGGS